MSAWEEARRVVAARTESALGVDGEGDDVQIASGRPGEMVRAVLSGFVPVDETDDVVATLDDLGSAWTRAFAAAGSPEARRANAMLTGAQLVALGVALEREARS